MSEEQLIAEAILQLKQESNVIKDYIFPIAMALFSSLIGAIVGYKVYLRQEKLGIEKEKLNIINKWILLSNEVQQDLLAIKQNYIKGVNKDPYKRIFNIPTILLNKKNYNLEYQELAFIENVSPSKFSHIPYLRTIFENYIDLVSIWAKRNELNDEVKAQIINKIPQNLTYFDVSRELIDKSVDQSKFAALIDLTEIVIRYTDDLIIELESLNNELPLISKKAVDMKCLKNFGSILNYGRSTSIELLSECPLPDFKKLSTILGRSEEELMARYNPLFKK